MIAKIGILVRQGDRRCKNLWVKGIIHSVMYSVVFEDEFDAFMPEENYNPDTPLGWDLLDSIMIPAFSKQRENIPSSESRLKLDQITAILKEFAVREPEASEKACRMIVEDLFASSRQSFKEFVASLAIPTLAKIDYNKDDNNNDDYDFDEQDEKKLEVYQSLKEEAVKIPPLTNEYQSDISRFLLERWIKR